MHLPHDKIDLFTYSYDIFNEDVLTEPVTVSGSSVQKLIPRHKLEVIMILLGPKNRNLYAGWKKM